MSSAKASGSSLNLSLQFVSRDERAYRTLSGFSNFVLAARHRSSFASRIATSGDVDDVIVADERKSAQKDDFGDATFGGNSAAKAGCSLVNGVGVVVGGTRIDFSRFVVA